MSRLPSRPDDRHPGPTRSPFFTGYPRHIMIDRLRIQLAPLRTRDCRVEGVVPSCEVPNLLRSAKRPTFYPVPALRRRPVPAPPSSFPRLPIARSLWFVSDASNKTHRPQLLQRFSPIHF